MRDPVSATLSKKRMAGTHASTRLKKPRCQGFFWLVLGLERMMFNMRRTSWVSKRCCPIWGNMKTIRVVYGLNRSLGIIDAIGAQEFKGQKTQAGASLRKPPGRFFFGFCCVLLGVVLLLICAG